MGVADNLGSLDGAFVVVDKSQHYESNDSSKQHVEQMPVRKVDAFVHKPLHTEPVEWLLADEPHVVSEVDSTKVNVYVSSAAARVDGCKLVAVVHDKNDNYSPSSPASGFGLKLLTVLVTTAVSTHVSAHALLLFPFRSKMFGAELCLSCLQWEYGAV